MEETGMKRLARRTFTYFGLDSIAYAPERQARERAQSEELVALRVEVEELKQRLARLERQTS